MALTDTKIKSAKPAEKPYKLYDERGLFLLVVPTGGKRWRFKYRFDDKEKLLALGTYPDVGLKDAREGRDAARKLIAQSIDPGLQRQAQKAAKQEQLADSFELVAREWHAKFSPAWAENHGGRILSRLERDIFPWIGGKSMSDITAPDLLSATRRIEQRGALETAHRALANCGQVFRYAVATGRAQRDPTGDLRGALAPVRGEHFASVTDPDKVGALLKTFDRYEGSMIVSCALRLAPLVFVRPGELRKAKWADFDLETAEWRFLVTKTKTQHIVPLSTQAMAILREVHTRTGDSTYVFPSAITNDRPMSDNAILAAMRRMGIEKDEMSGHGFRAMARTILDEVLGARPDLIEHQLAHAVKDPNGRAYNRTAHLHERRKMMQQWSDYLDSLKAGNDPPSTRPQAS